ncbi:MAG: GNAT family N-acetyltransferase [Anaerolineae bacterium]|nr:GNAT family N-acetyltransferase [Anaerolineae bacterium]
MSDDRLPHTIRPITLADLDMVNQIDRQAFETYRRQQHQLLQPMYPRTTENLRAAIERPYPGVVIEWRNRVVGYCFTHVWGALGWLGTLGIAPRSQGLGLGRAVIDGGLTMLRQAGCVTLALETMPESGKNLALYTRLGLDPRGMTLLCQGAPPPAAITTFTRWDNALEPEQSALREIASCLMPGLDPSPAARWLIAEEAGETLIWWERDRPVAFAVLRSGPRRMDTAQGYLTIEAAGCLPTAAARWPRYLSEIQAYGEDLHKAGLVLPVNARQIGLLRAALDAGLRIVHTRVRMVQGAPLGDHDALLLLTLAM